jgi:hypothetical protein
MIVDSMVWPFRGLSDRRQTPPVDLATPANLETNRENHVVPQLAV